jgi:hypothetical protein
VIMGRLQAANTACIFVVLYGSALVLGKPRRNEIDIATGLDP